MIDGTAVLAEGAVGGFAKAEVSTMFSGAGGPPRRQISKFGYTNLQVKLGLQIGAPILSWVNAALAGTPITKDGSLIELDDQGRAKSYLDFTKASIADFEIPGFDGSSKAQNTFTLEASITKSILRPGDNASIKLALRPKPFLTSNFRLTVDGLPTTRVRSIAPLSFRRGGAGIAPSDLVVTLAAADVDPWRAWVDDFIVKGNNAQGKEKQGTLEVLAPNVVDVLATLAIRQIGIFELRPIDDAASRSYQASMYFEFGQLTCP
jgi:hypothetical protein